MSNNNIQQHLDPYLYHTNKRLSYRFSNIAQFNTIYRVSRIIIPPPPQQVKPEGPQSSPEAHFKAYFNTNGFDTVTGMFG